MAATKMLKITVGCLTALIIIFGWLCATQWPPYRFEQAARAAVGRFPGARLISSEVESESLVPWLVNPIRVWDFAIPDPLMDGRFYVTVMRYERKPWLAIVDVNCTTQWHWVKLYDLDEPKTALPARNPWGDPVVAPNGETYRKLEVGVPLPPGWLHSFCDTNWDVEREAARNAMLEGKAPWLEDGGAAFARGDHATALSTNRSLAEHGLAEGQYNLGLMYANGSGVAQDYAEAAKWYRLAATHGLTEAQNNLAELYMKGDGVAQDYAEAVKWYRLAAEGGYVRARYNLGQMYRMGYGVAQDHAEAVKWYRLAAEQGYADAQNNLGASYLKGDGIAQDYAEAVRWYRLAATQGVAMAQNNLAELYAKGHGVARDYAEAVRWYRLAAEQGYADAQNNLGVMYEFGFLTGVAQDYVRALMWFNLGSTSGDAKIVKNRDDIAAKMTSQQIAEAQEMAQECRQRNLKDCD